MQYWQSTFFAANQSSYLMRCWLPTQPAPADGYPLLFMLDGDWILPSITSFLQQQPQGCDFVIATLGFDLERQAARQRRSYEYTPVPPAPYAAIDPRTPSWPAGGAPYLLDFIQHQALPELQKLAPINRQRLGLFGHSYGGLFTLYVFLKQPHLFKHYIAASPSLWWYEPFMQTQATLLPPLSLPTELSLLIGDQEQLRPKPADPQAPRPEGIPTSRFLQQFIDGLPPTANLNHQLHVYPGADHGRMLGLATEFALQAFKA